MPTFAHYVNNSSQQELEWVLTLLNTPLMRKDKATPDAKTQSTDAQHK